MTRVIAIVVAALVLILAVPGQNDAQTAKKKRSLASIRLTDADGIEVELDSEKFAGKKLAICFLTTWSEMSIRQATAVVAQARAKGFDGQLVMVCGGPEREVRGLRLRLGIDGAVWLKSSGTMGNDFRDAFEPALAIDRVPALLVVDESRIVSHSSVGELSAAELADVFASK